MPEDRGDVGNAMNEALRTAAGHRPSSEHRRPPSKFDGTSTEIIERDFKKLVENGHKDSDEAQELLAELNQRARPAGGSMDGGLGGPVEDPSETSGDQLNRQLRDHLARRRGQIPWNE